MNQKLENILNVSLDATEDELRKADSLSTGYNWRDNTWEIIVKYSGSLESIRNRYNVYIKELLNYYAIIVADKATIELISQEDVIDYVEKPKSLYYQIERTKTAACVGSVRADGNILSGKGVIVGVIDTGIDIFDNAFFDGFSEIKKAVKAESEEENERKKNPDQTRGEGLAACAGHGIIPLQRLEAGRLCTAESEQLVQFDAGRGHGQKRLHRNPF